MHQINSIRPILHDLPGVLGAAESGASEAQMLGRFDHCDWLLLVVQSLWNERGKIV